MSSAVTWQTESDSPERTEKLAELIGRSLKGGETVELVSDLGGGKTTFVRGLVRGAGSHDKVASPTFTISKFYKTDELEIHHFDFYRLHEAGIVANEVAEVAGDPQSVVVVEWAEVVHHVLPKHRLTVRILQTPEGNRVLELSYPETLSYLVKEAKV